MTNPLPVNLLGNVLRAHEHNLHQMEQLANAHNELKAAWTTFTNHTAPDGESVWHDLGSPPLIVQYLQQHYSINWDEEDGRLLAIDPVDFTIVPRATS